MVEPLEFSVYLIILSASSENFTSSFLIWIPIYLSWLIVLARISSIMLNKNVENVSDFMFLIFNFSPLSIMLAVNLSYMTFIMLSYNPSIPNFLSFFLFFNHERMFCQVLSCIYCIIRWFLSFILLINHTAFIDLHMLNHPCISWINRKWLWCIR